MAHNVLTATEAVRSFSEILSGVRYRGSRYTILRGGKPIATIGPVEGASPSRTLAELPSLLQPAGHT
jgi:antitoxin (DNA-binding transcriptional repressor) of toxin-antitoxin stability system